MLFSSFHSSALAISENQSEEKESPAGCSADKRKLSLCADQ
ncbi:putative surface exclusion protein [Escherichia coli P0304777.1]|nr:putative surface exclusion protein [Escherichia coli P0304777.1]